MRNIGCFILIFSIFSVKVAVLASEDKMMSENVVEESEDFFLPEDLKIDPTNEDSFSLQRWRIFETDALPPLEVYKPSVQDLENIKDKEIFKMQEFDTNYIIFGKPDTKIQFSFMFKFFRKTNIYLGYTQTMFWDLFQKDSSPFSEINFNPELFYRWSYENAFFNEIDLGYAHISNGKDDVLSRSVDSIFLSFMLTNQFKYGVPRTHLHFRYLLNEDKTNKDIYDFYGPLVIKFYFDKLGKKLFLSEEFYVEYYNGGKRAEDFSKSSVRVSARFKLWKSSAAPKIFMQYFNGYGENLLKYNLREETFRIGFSIGGF